MTHPGLPLVGHWVRINNKDASRHAGRALCTGLGPGGKVWVKPDAHPTEELSEVSALSIWKMGDQSRGIRSDLRLRAMQQIRDEERRAENAPPPPKTGGPILSESEKQKVIERAKARKTTAPTRSPDMTKLKNMPYISRAKSFAAMTWLTKVKTEIESGRMGFEKIRVGVAAPLGIDADKVSDHVVRSLCKDAGVDIPRRKPGRTPSLRSKHLAIIAAQVTDISRAANVPLSDDFAGLLKQIGGENAEAEPAE